MRKRKLFSLLVLLMTAVTGAWADDYLYLEVNGTSATVKYGADKGTKPYYREDPNDPDSYGWYVAMDEYMPDQVTDYNGKKTLTTVTIDASCQNYTGTTLESFFDFWSGLTTINNLENLNTSEVTNMKRMFAGCSSLTSLDPSSWNTAKVTNMYYMFNSVSVETLDLSGWNTSSVTNMYCMFYNCSKLETIYVGDGWSTASVTNGDLMFGKCTSLPGFDSGNVTHAMAKLTTDGGYLTYKAPEPEPSTYTVTLKEGTEDATNWQGKVGEGEYQSLPLEGVAAGTAVTVKYNGTKKVKSVKAVKKAAAEPEPAGPTYPVALNAVTTSDYVGSVITSDGYVYAKASDATAASKTAVAIIAYVGTAGSVDSSNGSYKGLAIAMSDCGTDFMQWTEKEDGIYVNQAGDITTAIGYKNGIACTNTLSNDGHTAAIAAASNNNTAAPAGTSGWFLPSMGQWNLILQGLATKKTGSAVTTDLLRNTENNTINANNLNSVITAAGGTAFKSNDYWSSTQYDDDWEAWSVKLGKGCAREYAFTNYCYVRSVLAF